MLSIIGVELWLTRVDAAEANAAFDRSLYGAIKFVELNVSTSSSGLAPGALRVCPPELKGRGKVRFSIV